MIQVLWTGRGSSGWSGTCPSLPGVYHIDVWWAEHLLDYKHSFEVLDRGKTYHVIGIGGKEAVQAKLDQIYERAKAGIEPAVPPSMGTTDFVATVRKALRE